MKKVYLVLANGRVFEGQAFGAEGTVNGELTFTTSVVGYLETITDPVNYGRIILQTFPMLGDYGVIDEDLLGKPYVKGFAVREWCPTPSNFRCDYDINTYMVQNGIVGICGIDTREITKIIREEGVMNAVITDTLPADKALLEENTTQNAVAAVNPTGGKCFKAENELHRVNLVDFGAKGNLITEFNNRRCTVTTFGHKATAAELLANHPNGVILSDGPGNPAELADAIKEIAALSDVPVFAVGLGHCLLALAKGAKLIPLKYGHMGGDQPVRHLSGVRSYITAQNHMFAVDASTVKDGAEIFCNINDNTNEGLQYAKGISCAFIPATCAGPQNTGFVFDEFIKLLGGIN